MKATEANLLKFLKKSPQFVIPIYQRHYSWTDVQCKKLWDDLLEAGKDDSINAHFVGSIVYVERALSTVTSQESLLVIDGQQRLTTSTLLISALANYLEEKNIPEILEAFSAKKLRNYYLLNPEEEDEKRFKLILSEVDKDTLLAILRSSPMPAKVSNRIIENYRFFQDLIKKGHDQLETICKGVAKLVIVDVSLERDKDDPQLIFESMNSTGLGLSQADLIRNYILMGLEPELQTELYKTYWRPIEEIFAQAADTEHFDAFIRHYLTAKTGSIPNKSNVYATFKRFEHENFKGRTKDLVEEIHLYAGYYGAIAFDMEQDSELKKALHDLRELKVDVSHPLLLKVYHYYNHGLLTTCEVTEIVRIVESYVFRRAICAIPTYSLNKTFANLSTLKKDRYLESLKAAFLLLSSYKRFPSDEEFQREVKTRDLYNFRICCYWLRRLENYGRKERVIIEDYTIEHILPQSETLSDEWKADLGEDWERIQNEWLHTLGNLTLTGYNSEYSDSSFATKRDKTDKSGRPIGFANSPLKLNRDIGLLPVWNETAIKERANRLATDMLKVWPTPQLEEEVLQNYRPSKGKEEAGKQYLRLLSLTQPLQELFEALSKEILALDPCVYREWFDRYIAFKAETNFVDINLQTKKLLLILNLGFDEINDPKNLCRNVSNIGHYGNGDVTINLTSIDELPYVMGIIRQSFERQMEDNSLSSD